MFIQMLWLMFASFGAGLVVGLLIKGIHVHVNQKRQEAPETYNQTYEDQIPDEYAQYIEKTKGMIE